MPYHKLLEKQISKFLDKGCLDDETMRIFLQVVSNSYSTFERDKKISDHAFVVSEKEYQAVTKYLQEQNNIHIQSIVKLKEAIRSLDPTIKFEEKDDDLINIISFLAKQISITKELESELILARDHAEKASRIKSEFLANMSHEIRTPLNGIVGMTDIALETKLTSEQIHYLTVIRSSSETLMGIINDILDFSKIEAGKLELSPVSFSFRDEIPKALQALGLKAFEKKLEFVFRLEQEVPDLLVGDVLRLQQIIINLLNNAIKFTEKGEVELKVALQSSCIEEVVLHFTVSDTGIGIPEDKLATIFEEFIQVDNSTSRLYGGTGLGLAISRRLVQMMGGVIWAESRPGNGSAFHFTMPLKRLLQKTEIQSIPIASLKHTPVLVVEDNKTASYYIQRMLQQFGLKPAAVNTGEDALVLLKKGVLQQHPYSLVLLDISLQGRIDGYTVAKLIKKNSELKDTPVIIISMSQKSSDRQRFARLGITDFFSKPFSQSELLNKIRSLLAAPGNVQQKSPGANAENDLCFNAAMAEKTEILLVEDNLVNQEVASSMLTRHGYSVTVAKNGQEAITRWRKKFFDIILMDVQMPVMNGYEATRKIREIETEIGRRTAIIGLTANAMNGDRKKCLESGMDDYISKPVRLKDLVAAIQQTQKKTGPLQKNINGQVPQHPPVNMELLLEKMDGEKTQLLKCLKLFQKELPGLLKAVENALQQKKSRDLKNACHDLRGMLLTMEMTNAVSIISEMELLAATRKLKALSSMLPAMKREIDLAILYIEGASI
jgi:two-component system, sensor histidine kinase and response regulator